MCFLTGPAGVALSFFWGIAEGTLFFIVPDVGLSFVAVFSPRRVWRHILAATLGAVCAGALLYAWAARNPLAAHSTVARVPFTSARMFAEVESGYVRHGIGAVFLGPLSGIPYKIYAIDAPKHFGMAEFLVATAPARAWRFILVSALAGIIAAWLRRRWHKNDLQLMAIHLVSWTVFYIFYWARIALS